MARYDGKVVAAAWRQAGFGAHGHKGAEAEEAQEYLMKLPVRFTKLAQRQQKAFDKAPREPRPWAWLNGREL